MGCSWHLGEGGQGCCFTFSNAQDSSATEIDSIQNIDGAKVEETCLKCFLLHGVLQKSASSGQKGCMGPQTVLHEPNPA
jgi:hypothetical protein